MDQGKIFEKLVKLACVEQMKVAFFPFTVSYGRLHGDRIGLWNSMTIEKINYTLAHELAHHFLHYDKGDTIESDRHNEYEEQADRAAKMLLLALGLEEVPAA